MSCAPLYDLQYFSISSVCCFFVRTVAFELLLLQFSFGYLALFVFMLLYMENSAQEYIELFCFIDHKMPNGFCQRNSLNKKKTASTRNCKCQLSTVKIYAFYGFNKRVFLQFNNTFYSLFCLWFVWILSVLDGREEQIVASANSWFSSGA